MDTNLEKLTKTLYDEGLAKGREEGERVEREARDTAARLISDAERRASDILQKANETAEELRVNTLNEVAMAGRQAVARMKDELSSLIVAKAISLPVHAANLDAEFIESFLLELAKNWRGGGASLEALLPEAEKAKFDSAFEKSAGELLANGIEVGYSPAVKTGFRVGEKNGGYYIEFSDDSFEALLGEYLRDRAAKLLYNK